MRYLGYKMTQEFATCKLCGYSNLLVKVGFMRWDHKRCPICLMKSPPPKYYHGQQA